VSRSGDVATRHGRRESILLRERSVCLGDGIEVNSQINGQTADEGNADAWKRLFSTMSVRI